MPKGSSWVPNAMLQQAEKNSPPPKHTGRVNVIRRGPKCQIWPRQPNRSSLPPWKGGEGHPYLQYMPNGSSWVPNAMLQQAENNSPAPKHTGGWSKRHSKRPKVPNLAQAANSELFAPL